MRFYVFVPPSQYQANKEQNYFNGLSHKTIEKLSFPINLAMTIHK